MLSLRRKLKDTTMFYKITFSCEEVDGFRRVFEADEDATFLDLHKAILASVGYKDDQMTSFFMMNENWEKEQEVTLLPMDGGFGYDNMVMENTYLGDLIEERGQRLIYVFDPMFERYFARESEGCDVSGEERQGSVAVEEGRSVRRRSR